MVQWLDAIPLWGVYWLVALIGMATIRLGDFLGRQWTQRSHAAKQDNVDSLVASILALLAFLLVFMAGLANTRFDAQRQLVLADANAIKTAWLRADFLDEPQRGAALALLPEYVAARLQAATDPAHLPQARARSEAIQAELWQYAAALNRAAPDSTAAALLTAAVNSLIDTHTQRIASLYNRFPLSNWVAIMVVALLSLLAVGYNDGLHVGRADGRGWVTELVLVLVFAAVLVLIVDLDRPNDGLINVSQQALIDLQQQMGAGGQ